MADVTVATQALLKTNALSSSSTAEAAKSYSEGDNIYVDVSNAKRIILAVTAGAASAVLTVKAGTGIAGTNDLTLSPTNGKVQFIELDTSSYEDIRPKLDDGTTNSAYGKIKLVATSKAGTMSAVSIL